MMIGEGLCPAPVIQVPPWPVYDPLPASGNGGIGGAGDCSAHLLGEGALAALQRFLPSNEVYLSDDAVDESDLPDTVVDAYSCDEFRMYEFKVRRCARGRSHDWTECPYAHPGEKARRRDPRKFHYAGTACPDFRKGFCQRGDACEYAHGVFECWLHPARYRTQPCKDGINCRRRVCFFAHTLKQLRVLPQSQQQQQQSPRAAVAAAAAVPDSYDGSPLRHHHHAVEAFHPKNVFSSSPTSTLMSPPVSPPSDSPPLSPSAPSPSMRRASFPVGSTVNDVLVSLRQLQLNKVRSPPAAWGLQFGGMSSPRAVTMRPGFCSLPATPTQSAMVSGGLLEGWEEPAERVESGRDLRAKIYKKLSKENLAERQDGDGGATGAVAAPDVGWVSELVK